MSHELNTQTRTGLFAGKARTVAAVAAFSGLALATTVSVQATQNASDQAPAAESTVSAQPAAKSDSAPAPKAKEKEQPKAEQAQQNTSSVVEAAPVSHTTELDAPAAAQQSAPVVSTVSEQAPAAAAPAAPVQVSTASENVTPLPEVPATQGRHVAVATADTQAKEAEAFRQAAPAAPALQTPNAAPAAPAPAAKAPAAPKVQTASNNKPAQSSNVPASQRGQAISNAALAQLGETQDCTQLVTDSLTAVGINFHGWPADYKQLGTIVPPSQAAAGDLAYYADGGMGMAHIAVYIGNGQAVHGGWNGNQTQVASVNVGSGPEFIRVN